MTWIRHSLKPIFRGLESYLRMAVVLLALFTYGCGTRQSREQQCADRYKTLMENWRNELVAHANKFNALDKPFIEDMHKTRSPEAAKKLHQLFIEDMRGMGGICTKYTELLAAEKPTEKFLTPYAKTKKMFTAMSDGCLEYARLLEVGNSKLASETFDAKMKEAQKYILELSQWVKPYDPRIASKLVAMAKDLEPMTDFSAINSADPKLQK